MIDFTLIEPDGTEVSEVDDSTWTPEREQEVVHYWAGMPCSDLRDDVDVLVQALNIARAALAEAERQRDAMRLRITNLDERLRGAMDDYAEMLEDNSVGTTEMAIMMLDRVESIRALSTTGSARGREET